MSESAKLFARELKTELEIEYYTKTHRILKQQFHNDLL